MAAVFLSLGGIVFQDFEVPEKTPFGGKQMLVTKKLVGGTRVIDAMGRDDADIKWSGRFRGFQAEQRARSLDYLRQQGQQVVLAWSTFNYLVVIEEFSGSFEQPYEVPYSINCVVIQDLAVPIVVSGQSPDSAIGIDSNNASLLAGDIGVTSITNAVANVSSAIAPITSFVGASSVQTGSVQTSIAAAQTAVTAQMTAQNGVVGASVGVGGAVGGLAPYAIAASLLASNAALGQLGQLYQLQALLGRVSLNVANAGS